MVATAMSASALAAGSALPDVADADRYAALHRYRLSVDGLRGFDLSCRFR